MIARKDAHADHAQWTIHTAANGSVVFCEGVFVGEDAGMHAQGTVRHLQHLRHGMEERMNHERHRTMPGAPDVHISENDIESSAVNDCWTVTARGVMAGKMAQWLRDHKKTHPALAITEKDDAPMAAWKPGREDVFRRGGGEMLPAPMLQVLKHPDYKEGLALVRAQTWQAVEAGHEDTGLAADIADPVTALKVAFFLKWNHLIDDAKFEKIRAEAAHDFHVAQASSGEPIPPVRIFVGPDKRWKLSDMLSKQVAGLRGLIEIDETRLPKRLPESGNFR